MLIKYSFDETEDKLDYYRGKDCVEKLCKKLKKHAMKIINYEEQDEEPLTDEVLKLCSKQYIIASRCV